MYLRQVRSLLKAQWNMDVLSNLERFPLNTDVLGGEKLPHLNFRKPVDKNGPFLYNNRRTPSSSKGDNDETV